MLAAFLDIQLLVAFLSGFLIVPFYIARNTLDSIDNEDSKPIFSDRFKDKGWWYGMIIYGFVNVAIIYFHSYKGAVFTTGLTLQVCTATTFVMKKATELSKMFDGLDGG